MRLPSLFKTPKHQQFHIKPRYYDPVKEYVEERRRVVASQMKEEADGDKDRYSANIRAGFDRSRGKATSPKAGMAQGLMVVGLTVTMAIYWFYGDWALYFFGIFIAAYIYMKVKGIL
ncbi:hypothetical protein [Persicobacter sp. CCB-QB2]|uniref:hypothetical protein n=1 Tax=Persicobacter sp. CCB-QB2 TaxID=1561025 RepID=UPI0006A99C91|nr:hypothetical protein [Persicobacter sp. CCB-QB2]